MLRMLQKLFFFFGGPSLYAMVIGNPAEPAILEKGILFKSSWSSVRFGYLSDWVYKQPFKEEFLFSEKTRTKNEFSTYAGMATVNFLKRLDLYGYLGSTQMQIDAQIFAKQAFSWCVGTKLMFLKHKNLFFGADIKYFETIQKPKFFVIEELPFNIVNNYHSKYFDLQAAIGTTYRMGLFAPYIHATYIYSHISPEPPLVLVRFPDIDEISDVIIPSLISRKNWGMAVGFSLIDISKASLSFEWRTFNQNALNVNGELRF